jgi:hypothetical protein
VREAAADENDLARAIGRVAMNSAQTDERLRRVIHELIGLDDAAWILFEGQPTEKLIRDADKLLELQTSQYEADLVAQLRLVLGDIRRLVSHRNIVVHGLWSSSAFWEEGGLDDDTITCPWGQIDDGSPQMFCFRSRYGRYDGQIKVRVSEVNALADMIDTSSRSLMVSYAKMRKRLYSWPTEWNKWLGEKG